MKKILFVFASLCGGLSVAMGAYGAHAGARLMSDASLVTFAKAVRYSMHHALILFVVVWALEKFPHQQRLLQVAGICFVTGIVCFSGSLYLLALTGISLGYITPLGGMAFLGGWFSLAWAGWRSRL